MKTTRKRLLYLMVGCAFGATPLAAQSDCKSVLDAMTKVISTPNHLYLTANTGGKTRTSETIYTASVIYMQINGKWMVSPLTPQDMARQQQKNIQNNQSTCAYLRDEAVNGEMAAVFDTHSETPRTKSASQIWVSKAKGLPLRQETDIEVAPGGSKTHHSMRYEYGDVKPPM